MDGLAALFRLLVVPSETLHHYSGLHFLRLAVTAHPYGINGRLVTFYTEGLQSPSLECSILLEPRLVLILGIIPDDMPSDRLEVRKLS